MSVCSKAIQNKGSSNYASPCTNFGLSPNTVYPIDLASSRSQSVIHCHAVILSHISQLSEETSTLSSLRLIVNVTQSRWLDHFWRHTSISHVTARATIQTGHHTTLMLWTSQSSDIVVVVTSPSSSIYLYGEADAMKKWEFLIGSGTHLKVTEMELMFCFPPLAWQK